VLCPPAEPSLTGCVQTQDSPNSLDHSHLRVGGVAFQPPPGLTGGLVLVPTQGPCPVRRRTCVPSCLRNGGLVKGGGPPHGPERTLVTGTSQPAGEAAAQHQVRSPVHPRSPHHDHTEVGVGAGALTVGRRFAPWTSARPDSALTAWIRLCTPADGFLGSGLSRCGQGLAAVTSAGEREQTWECAILTPRCG
jgi:hypothetical protein